MESRKQEPKVRPVRAAPPLSAMTPLASDLTAPTDIHFGTLLRKARERRGMSIQDVARVTRISDKWLPALEDARLEFLPAPVFVSGYVRSYARIVGLDESDLLDRYYALNQRHGFSCPPTQLPISGDGAEPSAAVATGRLGTLVLAGLAGLLVLALVLAVLHSRGVL